ncbi:MAG: UbiA family prenyltransferase [Polyangiaceae bacterium]|nr:UbiA family prenyltransferase [Myxococcales bacterium]MCB9588632.1 UbiA family prenyltransferase [Polyangiaceae bacterium]
MNLRADSLDHAPEDDRQRPVGVRDTLSALWRLSRPQGAFWLSWIVLIGYGFTLWDWGMGPRGVSGLVVILISWWLLNAGSLWLNAVLDDDQGEVLFQPSPVALPRGTAVAGYLALTSAVVVSAFSRWPGVLCASGAAILAVLYSHPRTRWKGHAWGGPFVNLAGYGLLTPIAGFAQTGLPPTARGFVTLLLLAAWILGAFFAAQAFQQREDAERGYSTLVVSQGAVGVIRVARWLMGFAMAGVVLGIALGYYPRLLFLGAPLLWLTDRYIKRWQELAGGAQTDSWGRAMAMGLHRRMMLSGALLFVLAYYDYQADYQADRPAAGWATARGRPPFPQRFQNTE